MACCCAIAFCAFAARALAICSGEWCAADLTTFGLRTGLVDFLRRRMR
jgi:hypothetical protein